LIFSNHFVSRFAHFLTAKMPPPPLDGWVHFRVEFSYFRKPCPLRRENGDNLPDQFQFPVNQDLVATAVGRLYPTKKGPMSINQLLRGAVRERNSLVCVGLDVNPERMPSHVMEGGDPIFQFNKAIIH